MKNEYTYKVTWVTETAFGIDRGEKYFETMELAYAFVDRIKEQKEFIVDFTIKKLEMTVIHTFSLI